MQRLEVSGAVRPLQGSLSVKWLNEYARFHDFHVPKKRHCSQQKLCMAQTTVKLVYKTYKVTVCGRAPSE